MPSPLRPTAIPGIETAEFGGPPEAPAPGQRLPMAQARGASPLRPSAIPGMDIAEFGTRPQAAMPPVAPASPAPVYGPGAASPLRATSMPGVEMAEFGTRPQAPVPGPRLPMANGNPTMAAPGNPNVGAAGSAEGAAFRAQQAANMGPRTPGGWTPPAAAAEAGSGAAYNAGRTVGAGLRAAAPGMVAAGGILGAADGLRTDTEQYAKRFGLEDTQPSLGRDLGIRALGVASDVGNNMLLGAPAALGLFRDRDGSAPAAPAAAAPVARPGYAGSGSSTAGAGRGSINPTFATEAAPMMGTDPGSAVAGADGVRKFIDAGGRTTYSNVPGDNSAAMGKGGTVSSVADGGAMGANLRAAAIYRSINGGGEQGSSYIPGVNAPATQYEQELAARNAGVHSTVGGTGGTAGRAQQALALQGQENAIRSRSNDVALAGHEMGLRGQMAGVDAQRMGHQLGYDAAVQGHEATQATARARLSYEVGKDNRDYGLRAAEFGQKQNEQNFTQNEKAEGQLQKNLEARFRAKDSNGNDVADTAKIADFRQAATTTIPALAKELEATGHPDAIAKAADLRKRGPAALEPGDIDAMHQLYQTRDRVAQSRGFGPNQGTVVDSHNLLDYRQKPGASGVEQRTLGGNRVNFQGGSSASVNDLRYADGPANRFLPDVFKVQSNDLTRGLRGQ